MKLGLGTVQFGLPYGISNTQGQTDHNQVKEILSVAKSHGITKLDTAHAYGSSEECLGRVLSAFDHGAVITKTPVFAGVDSKHDAIILQEAFQASLDKLMKSSLYGLQVHHGKNLLAKQGDLLWDAMVALKQAGLVKKIGVSVYCPQELAAILTMFPIDIVQLPLNIFDQRFLHSGMLEKLATMGVEVHVRSVFLQGLLLMKIDDVPAKFSPFNHRLHAYHKYLEQHRLTMLQASLGFVCAMKEVDLVIVGVNTSEQLLQIIQTVEGLSSCSHDARALSCGEDEQLINPSLWHHL